MIHSIVKIHPKDNALVALTNLRSGEIVTFQGKEIKLVQDVPAKHKFAEEDLKPNDEIYMYGLIVGRATVPISKGEVLTTQNIAHKTATHPGLRDHASWEPPNVDRWKDRTFM